MKNTTPRATSRRMPSMPANAVTKSARTPPGPATKTASPVGVSVEATEAFSALAPSYSGLESPITSAAVLTSSSTGTSSALPSWLGTAAAGGAARYGPREYPLISKGRDGIPAMKLFTASASEGFRPVGRSITTKYGSASVELNFAASLPTSVDSADLGRNDALSFFCTSDSRPTSGPPTPASPNQANRTRTSTNRRVSFVRPVGFERSASSCSGVMSSCVTCSAPRLVNGRLRQPRGSYAVSPCWSPGDPGGANATGHHG